LAVEPPLRVEHREELVWLLAQACELEHGLMCEYLFAQFTLKRSADEELSLEQLAKVATWEAVLVEVTKQEMLHLALATNLLTAIGAAPHLHRPNFPILSRWYPPGVQVALLRFGERALRHFIYLERREGMDLDDAEGFAAVGQAQPLTDGDQLMAVPEDYQTVGHFGKFVALLDDYLATRAADPGFEPARPVQPAYVRRPPDVQAETVTITDPLTAQVVDLFNAVYESTLQTLSRYFVHSTETDGQVRILATTAKHLMNWVMRPLGSFLTTLPVGSDRPGVLTGPAFEIVGPLFYVLPHREAAWRILAERLQQLADGADRLSGTPGLGQLAELATDLRGMAHDLQAA
jgi:hypothetical protein